jgi:hypothetical protein
MEEVSHKQIYDRLLAVEQKVNEIDDNTKGLVAAFNAAQGAFTVLEFLAKVAKPILWVGGLIALVGIAWQGLFKK